MRGVWQCFIFKATFPFGSRRQRLIWVHSSFNPLCLAACCWVGSSRLGGKSVLVGAAADISIGQLLWDWWLRQTGFRQWREANDGQSCQIQQMLPDWNFFCQIDQMLGTSYFPREGPLPPFAKTTELLSAKQHTLLTISIWTESNISEPNISTTNIRYISFVYNTFGIGKFNHLRVDVALVLWVDGMDLRVGWGI